MISNICPDLILLNDLGFSVILWSVLVSPKLNIIGFWESVMDTSTKSEKHNNCGFSGFAIVISKSYKKNEAE